MWSTSHDDADHYSHCYNTNKSKIQNRDTNNLGDRSVHQDLHANQWRSSTTPGLQHLHNSNLADFSTHEDSQCNIGAALDRIRHSYICRIRCSKQLQHHCALSAQVGSERISHNVCMLWTRDYVLSPSARSHLPLLWSKIHRGSFPTPCCSMSLLGGKPFSLTRRS